MTENYQKPSDFGRGEQGEVRRWLMELSLADKRDKDWRDCGKKIWDIYRGKGRKKNSFNILWSNTETLAPAVFNSPPQPNVRRRYKDADPVGKVGAQVLERCLEFQTDTEHFMNAVAQDVLDMLLPGRGVSRIRYVPSVIQVGESQEQAGDELMEGASEQLAWEQCIPEHVQWDDYRMGPGKVWNEVQWEAFRHRMTRDELIESFGKEKGSKVTLDEPDDTDLKKDGELLEVFQTAEVWEIWDKEARKVRFVCNSHRDSYLKVVDDPLKLNGFYPNPRPLYAIQDSASLEPVALYEQYREQADELNRISTRINKLIDACKLRGLYDAALKNDIAQLMKAGDNELIPTTDAAAWVEKGGLEKAIFMMPVEDVAKALALLYQQRDACKQVIYEITGIADVMRGATDPNETLGAQQLKAQWGGQRVQAMQREVQRYARDMMRLMAEVAGERFQPDTILRMTQLKIPTQAQVAQMQMQAQTAGLPFQPPPATLEQVMQVLRDDATRTFKIDVETDSMVAATMQQDMQAMEQVLGGISQLVTGLGPAVQSGAMPVEAVKEMILSVARRAKLGTVVEDALEKIQQPAPQMDPNQVKADAEAAKLKAKQELDQQALAFNQQMEQQKLAFEQQAEQTRAQADIAVENNRLQGELAMAQRQAEFDRQLQMMQAQQDAISQQRQAAMDAKLEILLAHIKKDTAIEVAHINNEGKKEIAANAPKPEPAKA